MQEVPAAEGGAELPKSKPPLGPNGKKIFRRFSNSDLGNSPSRPHETFVPLGPQTHRLPYQVIWGITLLTAVAMALINFCSVLAIAFIVQLKFATMQSAINRFGVAFGICVLTVICMALAGICMALIFLLAPAAGSSGSSENKGWLNGNALDNYFTTRNLLVRQAATMLSNTAGFPVGREGPTVTMGSNVAYLITERFATPYVKQWVSVDEEETVGGGAHQAHNNPMMIDQERLAHAQRIVCTVGGACGMAMLFDSPIGGIVYMFEEITSSSWPMEVTMRAFVGTTITSVLSRFMLEKICGISTQQFVIYDFHREMTSWGWVDLPFFILLAVIMGPFSAFHARACLAVGSVRQRALAHFSTRQRTVKAAEGVLYIAICALTYCFTSLHSKCLPLPPRSARDFGGQSLEFVKFNCEAKHYNPVASLLLTTSEGAVKRLFSRLNVNTLHLGNECLSFLAYAILNIGLTGVSVPSGNFTGSMLIGGLMGRIMGASVHKLGIPTSTPSGVYSMIGSATMLCGFKRMNVAVVIFISHCANDLDLVPALMVSVTIALLLNRCLLERSYDEEQIRRKSVPFLPAEPPRAMDNACALELIDALPEHCSLPTEASHSRVTRALKAEPRADIFPVVKPSQVCVGFATRDRLEAAVQALSSHEAVGNPVPAAENGHHDQGEEMHALYRRKIVSRSFSDFGRNKGGLEGGDASDVSIFVERLADRTQYSVLKDMPAPRVYALFSKAGAQMVCVVCERGKFLGTVSRPGLIAATRKVEEEGMEALKKSRADERAAAEAEAAMQQQ